MSSSIHPKVFPEDPNDDRHFDTPEYSSTTRFSNETPNPRLQAITRSLNKMLSAFDTWFEANSTEEERNAVDLNDEKTQYRVREDVMAHREECLKKLGAGSTDVEAHTVAVEWTFDRNPTDFTMTIYIGGDVKLWSIGNKPVTRQEAEEHERTERAAANDNGIVGTMSTLTMSEQSVSKGPEEDESEEEVEHHVSQDLQTQKLNISGTRRSKWWTLRIGDEEAEPSIEGAAQ
jgi:hypothetical protein